MDENDLYFIVGQLYVELIVAKNEIQRRDSEIQKLQIELESHKVERADNVVDD